MQIMAMVTTVPILFIHHFHFLWYNTYFINLFLFLKHLTLIAYLDLRTYFRWLFHWSVFNSLRICHPIMVSIKSFSIWVINHLFKSIFRRWFITCSIIRIFLDFIHHFLCILFCFVFSTVTISSWSSRSYRILFLFSSWWNRRSRCIANTHAT